MQTSRVRECHQRISSQLTPVKLNGAGWSHSTAPEFDQSITSILTPLGKAPSLAELWLNVQQLRSPT